jgi:hypothetical protein
MMSPGYFPSHPTPLRVPHGASLPPKVPVEPVTPVPSAREELVDRLRGSQITIPDLHALFRHWPQNVSSHARELEAVADVRLKRYQRILEPPGRLI